MSERPSNNRTDGSMVGKRSEKGVQPAGMDAMTKRDVADPRGVVTVRVAEPSAPPGASVKLVDNRLAVDAGKTPRSTDTPLSNVIVTVPPSKLLPTIAMV